MAYMEDARKGSAQGAGAGGLSIPRTPARPLIAWTALFAVAAALALWEAAGRLGLISAVFFPGPTVIADALWRMFASEGLLGEAGVSVGRMGLGFLCGAAPALALGLMMGRSARLRAAVDPLVASAHPIPKITILPLVMLIFGMGETSKVLVIALAAFFPVLINTMAGARQISAIHFEVAQNYGASALRTIARVLLPGSLPMLMSGVRLALNIALLSTMAMEMMFATRGLGALVWRSWQTMRTEEIYATLAVIAGIGICINLAIQALTRRLVPWQVDREV
jgi:ABC-type nitrate/sulfonate/bicarbonate transport system permease component